MIVLWTVKVIVSLTIKLRIETKGRSIAETKDGSLIDEIIIWNYSRNSAEKGFTVEKKTLVEN